MTHSSEDAPPSLEFSGAIAIVRLRRPVHANRIERSDVDVLHTYWRMLRDNSAIRCVIITGTGKHFSAGYDLGSVLCTLQAASATAAQGMSDQSPNSFAHMVDELETLPQITVCAINGGIFGGATDLGLACDFRLGVPGTRMFMPAAQLGLPYYASGLRRFVTRLGTHAAKRLVLLAEEFDARGMLALGYLDAIVADAELMHEAMRKAELVASTAPLASAAMKAAINAISCGVWDPVAAGRSEQACLCSADLKEGVAAWHEKRRPRFEGR